MSAPFQYKALYVRLRAGCGFVKPLFIKPHTAAPEDEAAAAFDGRSIFVAGVPKRMDKAQLEEVFALFGPLTTVVLHPVGTSGVVVFESCASVEAVLRAAAAGGVVDCFPSEDASQPVGLKAFVQAHAARYPGTAVLQEQLNAWTEHFEGAEERKRLALEAASADDGWTVVTNKAGRKRAAGSTVSGGISQAAAQAHHDRKKPKLAADFYKHQAREQKKNEVLELRRQFADAQKQVAEMKRARNFHPGAVAR